MRAVLCTVSAVCAVVFCVCMGGWFGGGMRVCVFYCDCGRGLNQTGCNRAHCELDHMYTDNIRIVLTACVCVCRCVPNVCVHVFAVCVV